MNYCKKDDLVAIATTGQIGRVCHIINRRTHIKDGLVMVQCGSGGPFVEASMAVLRELSQKEIEIATGVRSHE